MYAYHLGPIDFGWEFMPTMADTIAILVSPRLQDYEDTIIHMARLKDFIGFLEEAFQIARSIGWEGDFRPGYEPRAFSVPVEDNIAFGLMWKQENNGSTFVVSPVELPHLAKMALAF